MTFLIAYFVCRHDTKWQSQSPFEVLRGKDLFCLFQHRGAACTPWLTAPPPSSKCLAAVPACAVMMPSPPNLRPPVPFLQGWLWFPWAQLDNPGLPPPFPPLNLTTDAEFLLQCEVRVHRLWGLECGSVWRAVVTSIFTRIQRNSPKLHE